MKTIDENNRCFIELDEATTKKAGLMSASDKVKLDEMETSINSQIETFDFTLAENITKIDGYTNKGYYNKLTGEVNIFFCLDVGQVFNSQHITAFEIPEKYRPSNGLYTVGTAAGGFLVQTGVASEGTVTLWSEATTSQGRGSINYFAN